MNTTTITRGIASIAAAGAIFAFSACGAEISPQPNDVGGATQQKAPESPTKTSPTRSQTDDEYGAPSYWPTPKADDWKGSGNRIDFGDQG